MGILTEEQAEAFAEKFEDAVDADVEVAHAEPEGEVEVEVEAEAGAADDDEVELEGPDATEGEAVEAAEDESAEAELPADDSEPEKRPARRGHRVTYSRFKQVNDRMKAAEARAAGLEAALEAVKGVSRTPEPDDYVDPEWSTEAEAPDMAEQAMVSVERLKLDLEIGKALEAHPDGPEELRAVIVDAVVRNPEVTASQVADAYMARRTVVEEAAIARYLAEQGIEPAADETERAPAVKAKPKAPRRPRKSGAKAGQVANADRPRTIEEASNRAESWFKTRNPFR